MREIPNLVLFIAQNSITKVLQFTAQKPVTIKTNTNPPL